MITNPQSFVGKTIYYWRTFTDDLEYTIKTEPIAVTLLSYNDYRFVAETNSGFFERGQTHKSSFLPSEAFESYSDAVAEKIKVLNEYRSLIDVEITRLLAEA